MDPEHFNTLWVDAHCERIARSLLVKHNVPVPTDEFVQRAGLRAWEHADEYDPDLSAFGTWFYYQSLAVMRTMIDEDLREKKHPALSLDEESLGDEEDHALAWASYRQWWTQEIEAEAVSENEQRLVMIEAELDRLQNSTSRMDNKKAVILKAMLDYIDEYGFAPDVERLQQRTGFGRSLILYYRRQVELFLRSKFGI